MQENLKNGEARYEELKADLELSKKGQYIAIDADSGDYEVGVSREQAVESINKKHPGKVPFSRRIGMVDSVSRHYFGKNDKYARIFR